MRRDGSPVTLEEWVAASGEWYVHEPNTGCHLWMRARSTAGYGGIRILGRDVLAHRLSYELHRGPIPAGLTIDHLCRMPSCVNPDHMEVVTIGENVRRGRSRFVRLSKTHCPKGHPYDEANTYRYRGRRMCRACNNAASAAYRRKRVAS